MPEKLLLKKHFSYIAMSFMWGFCHSGLLNKPTNAFSKIVSDPVKRNVKAQGKAPGFFYLMKVSELICPGLHQPQTGIGMSIYKMYTFHQ